jgi:hypothetical protein
MALSRRQGLEYPVWAVRVATDPEERLGEPLRNASEEIVCRHVGRELMHLLFVLRGPKSDAIKPWPSFWRSALSVFGLNGTGGKKTFYNWRNDDWKVFWSDCCYTISDQLFKRKQ